MREPYKVGWHHAIKSLFEEYKRLKAIEPKSDEIKEKVRSLREGIIFLCEPFGLDKRSPLEYPEYDMDKRPWDDREAINKFDEGLQKSLNIFIKNRLLALDVLGFLKEEGFYAFS
jgi:hypothetical protein